MLKPDDKLKSLPQQPGVYIFKGENKQFIYIGKAKNLKNRVSSYFLKSADHNNRISIMVSHIVELEWIVTSDHITVIID